MNMQLFHTSPTAITKIDASEGRFGEFLFFSVRPYSMTANQDAVLYEIEIDENDIIDSASIFYQDGDAVAPIIAEFAELWSVSEDDAVTAIEKNDARESVFQNRDWEEAADMVYSAQHFAARCAKALGYRGVSVTDEQGSAYMIDMLGHESELEIAK